MNRHDLAVLSSHLSEAIWSSEGAEQIGALRAARYVLSGLAALGELRGDARTEFLKAMRVSEDRNGLLRPLTP